MMRLVANVFEFGSKTEPQHNAVAAAAAQRELEDRIAEFTANGGAVVQLDSYGNQIGEYKASPVIREMTVPEFANDLSFAVQPDAEPACSKTCEPFAGDAIDQQFAPAEPMPELSFKVLVSEFARRIKRKERGPLAELRSINREAAKISAKLDAIEARIA